MKNMTALVSAFARACRYRDNSEWVFADRFAEKILAEGGSDNPLPSGGESRRTRELASAAGEQMKARYTYHEMRTLLEETGFSICDHMNAGGATERFSRVVYETLSNAVCGFRANAAMPEDWSARIDADYRKRGKNKR